MQETYYYVLCLRNGKDGHPRAELRLTNRDIPVPEGADVQSLAVRVLAYFEKPNSVIEMSPEARAVFTGLQSCFNCQAALLRSEATSEAAREGTGLWFVAILAAANLIFEIGLGKLENTEAFRNRQLQLQPRHVRPSRDGSCSRAHLDGRRPSWRKFQRPAAWRGGTAHSSGKVGCGHGRCPGEQPVPEIRIDAGRDGIVRLVE